ncbi:hypothetical protein PVAP13_6KG343906 [Panicum virgatum]|uniref:Uncharacterized protein n=1 Tax=Panicum virgatum TaxID=38727 RepID=A0A8T0RJ48_PANVG|nr:hypothetical protein PVAP13_6KG343906 [Panicum virgatum]
MGCRFLNMKLIFGVRRRSWGRPTPPPAPFFFLPCAPPSSSPTSTATTATSLAPSPEPAQPADDIPRRLAGAISGACAAIRRPPTAALVLSPPACPRRIRLGNGYTTLTNPGFANTNAGPRPGRGGAGCSRRSDQVALGRGDQGLLPQVPPQNP